MVRRQPQRAPADAPGLALHAAAARLDGLLKERARLLREISKRKRLIEQARAKAERDSNEASSQLGPLFLRHQALVRELTALFDALQREPRPTRARNVIGRLRASLEDEGLLEPQPEPEAETETDSRRRRPSSAASSSPDFPSAQQPTPERRSLREIFRTLARALHPDQARTDAERERRTEVMKDLTRAFARGDLARLLELESEWQATRAPAADASHGSVDAAARCQELERTNRELLKQVRQLTGELKDAKDDARHQSPGVVARTRAKTGRELERLEALCELVREFKSGSRSLSELALGQSLI